MYPKTLFNSHIKKFISVKYTAPSVSWCVRCQTKEFFLLYPVFGRQSEQFTDELLLLLNSFYPSFDFKIVLVNSFTIRRLFNYEDKVHAGMRSSLDYEFSCAHCASKYIGSTMRAICSKVAEHAGWSSRTGNI